MYNKKDIDRQSEREAKALDKQGQAVNQQHKRHKIKANYNRVHFDKLFKD